MDKTTPDTAGGIPAAAASSENVRLRVSTWLSGLVEEVRRKSPIHRLPKWDEIADSPEINIEAASDDTDRLINYSEKQLKRDASQSIPSYDEKTNSTKYFWNAGNFFSRVRSIDHSSPSETEEQRPATTETIRSLGKAKINEFYDKVRINKTRYNMLRNRSVIDESTQNTSESDVRKHDNTGDDDDILSSTRNNFTNAMDELSLSDTNLEISESGDTSFNYGKNRRPPLGTIGRSSTSYHPSNSPPLADQQQLPLLPQSPNLTTVMQKSLIGSIGRSFSEQTDDEDNNSGGSSFMLNERSRSYSQAIGERPCTRNASNNNSSDNVSSSLPTFFDHESLPVSLVPQYKEVARSRAPSLSDTSGPRRSLLRDSSLQSDSSHCSSVESLLEARKPDPEAILVSLGFGPAHSEDVLSKIPKRFLKPSQVKGIDIDTFLRQQQMANHLHDHSVLGYRGLLGNPDIAPSLIVAKIMERFEQNERNRCIIDINMNRPQSAPPTPGPNQ